MIACGLNARSSGWFLGGLEEREEDEEPVPRLDDAVVVVVVVVVEGFGERNYGALPPIE